MTLIAIWSISLVVNLPGLAITPVLGSLEKIFSHVSELEIQLLTVLPNLCIIPFVLLSGKLSMSKSKIKLVVVALSIFLISAIAYFFARSMTALIVISCLLGIGAGLVIPLAAGLLADTFVGKYRMQQLGIKSGISNLALVAATFVVGWLGHSDWHLPFAVYLIVAIPLVLSVFLRGIPKADLYDTAPNPNPAKSTLVKMKAEASVPAKAPQDIARTDDPAVKADTIPYGKVKDGFIISRTVSLVAVYFFICYASVIVSYYLPFLMESHGMGASKVSIVTSLFFLAVFLPGFLLAPIVRRFKQSTLVICSILMAGGMVLTGLCSSFIVICLAAMMVGVGYGVFQPLIYDKATRVVTDPKKLTLALAVVLAANYISVSATPFIVNGFADMFGQPHSPTFPFIFNAILTAAFTVVVVIFRKKFVFAINKSFY